MAYNTACTRLDKLLSRPKRNLELENNPSPTHLAGAGAQETNGAAFAAYGWLSDLSDEEILERLLALNLERENSNDE